MPREIPRISFGKSLRSAHCPSNNGQRDALQLSRIGPDHDLEFARLDDELLVDVPEREPVGRDVEGDRLRLAGLQADSLKPFSSFTGA